MSNSEGKTLPYSDAAFNRGVTVGGSPSTEHVNVPTQERSSSTSIWIGAADPSAVREITGGKPTPAAIVSPNANGRVEGTDFDGYRGGGVLQSIRDGKTGDIIGNRAIDGNDLITITTNMGREMTVRVKQALAEGFLYQDAQGNYHEADRASQQAAFDQIQKVEAAKAESERVKYDSEVENAVADIQDAMAEEGLNFGDELATFLGDDNGAPLSEPANAWAQNEGLDMRENLQAYMSHLREAVTEEVLRPNGIDPEAFIEWLQTNGLVRSRAVKATLFAHYAKRLDGFHSLAAEFRNTGMRYKQKRG